MTYKRLLIEFGQGVDMHGGDQNNAVRKAVQDAVHHCCMAGLFEIFDMKDLKKEAKIHADVYVPYPEKADPAVVTDSLEWWTVDVDVHQGGANPRGIALGSDPKTEITIALVVLTIYVAVED